MMHLSMSGNVYENIFFLNQYISVVFRKNQMNIKYISNNVHFSVRTLLSNEDFWDFERNWIEYKLIGGDIRALWMPLILCDFKPIYVSILTILILLMTQLLVNTQL